MKFVISFFLLSLSVSASPINLHFEDKVDDARIYRSILMKDYSIPEELIEMKKTVSCEGTKAAGKLDLCLKKNGDLFVVSVHREFINESLKVFQSP